MFALEVAETERVVTVNSAGLAMVGLETAYQSQRTFVVTAGGEATIASEILAAERRFAIQVAYVEESLGIWTSYFSSTMAGYAAYETQLTAIIEALYTYLLSVELAYYSDRYGIV